MDYLVLAWPRGQPSQDGQVLSDLAAAKLAGFRQAVDVYRLSVFVSERRGLNVHVLSSGAGVVIGEIFDRVATDRGLVKPADLSPACQGTALDAAAYLTTACWGRFVAVLCRGDDPPLLVRSAFSSLECLYWRRDEVTVAASFVPTDPDLGPHELSIDWQGVAAVLRNPRRVSEIVPLEGLAALPTGACAWSGDNAQSIALWRPSWFASQKARAPAGDDHDRLRRVTAGCVAAVTAPNAAMLCEISGGLDSAIVASSLAKTHPSAPRAINVYWPTAESDERVYARAVADALAWSLIEERQKIEPLGHGALTRLSRHARPSFNAIDPAYDRVLGKTARRLKARQILTGQGGDAIFFQMAHPSLALDILLSQARMRPKAAWLAALARRSGQSVTRLIAQALLAPSALNPTSAMDQFITSKAVRLAGPLPHSWMARQAGVCAAKRVQIEALVNNLVSLGASGRGQVAQLTHPLLTQPLVELCLSIPAHRLAAGSQDRMLARAAFDDCLPQVIVQRRGKGDVSAFFAKTAAASLGALRPFLIDGQLVQQGLLDPVAIDSVLNRDQLMWQDGSSEIMIAAVMEAWVRHWQGMILTRDQAPPR